MSRSSPEVARSTSLLLTTAGGITAFAITARAGRANPSVLLVVAMSLWVSVPFVLLIALHARRWHWSERAQWTLHVLAPAMAIGMLLIHWLQLFKPARSANAFLYVAVPPLASIAIGGLAAVLFWQTRSTAKQA